MKFNEGTRRLLDARNVATVATLNPDGGPQTSVVWIVRDGDFVLFSTQKYLGQGPPGEAGDVLRLIVRVTPQKITGFSA